MADDLYPYASVALLTPESRTEPRIEPRQLIFHSHGTTATSEAVQRYFNKLDVVVESTFSGKLDGRLLQFQYLDRQADAQAAGNGFHRPDRPGVLLGAVSVESEGTGPWSDAQVATFSLLAAWMHIHKGIPLEVCPRPDADGIGWHRLFPQWNPHHHACPGADRERQVVQRIIPNAVFLAGLSQHRSTDIVDEFKFIAGSWQLQRDGGVIPTGAAPFYGSYPGLPPAQRQGEREFATIDAWNGGYVLTSTKGEQYHFGPPKPE